MEAIRINHASCFNQNFTSIYGFVLPGLHNQNIESFFFPWKPDPGTLHSELRTHGMIVHKDEISPQDLAFSQEDLAAISYQLLGIDSEAMIHDLQDRHVPISSSKPLWEVIA
ncbi:MAG: hypothetical protein CMN03_06985 [Roseibacillus sp.]|nr:hypothetical protein [Roseibacillus sp.]